MFSISKDRGASEQEGVYIGGWTIKYLLTPEKLDGKHGRRTGSDKMGPENQVHIDSIQDRMEKTTTVQD
jgi:hypothetical protein